MPPESCPHCGADVPPDARACPECGSDERTGWSDEASASGLALPDDAFDYDDFAKRELGGAAARPRGISRFWWLAAGVILLLLLVALFGVRF
jgi:hypothetical protein